MIFIIFLCNVFTVLSYSLVERPISLSVNSNFKKIENINDNKYNYQFSDYKTTVTLMRHADTYNNQNDIWTGEIDTPILKPDFDRMEMGYYDLVLCSSALRCKQTLNLLEFKNKPKIIYDDSFLEAGYGDLTGKNKNDNIFRRKFFNKPPESFKYKSESIFEAGVRSYFGFAFLADPFLYKNTKILVLSHKNTLKGLWSFLNLDYMMTLEDEKSLNDIEIDIKNLIEEKSIPNFDNLVPHSFDLL